ncbi:MAG: hypothetical protein Q8S84_05110 [bacterium]|nr:hypothetical protein [bacterium]MDP3380873.1 hypothetical protein [bacterium]
MQAINSKKNVNIIIYLRALKFLEPLLSSPCQGRDSLNEIEIKEIINLKNEIENSVKS